MRILMSGATGMIGSKLLPNLVNNSGHEVYVLARDKAHAYRVLPLARKVFSWDSSLEPELDAFEGVQAIIHLAGSPIARKLWSKEVKYQIYA